MEKMFVGAKLEKKMHDCYEVVHREEICQRTTTVIYRVTEKIAII